MSMDNLLKKLQQVEVTQSPKVLVKKRVPVVKDKEPSVKETDGLYGILPGRGTKEELPGIRHESRDKGVEEYPIGLISKFQGVKSQ